VKQIIVDANVAVKWLIPEPGYQLARRLLQMSALDNFLFAPDLIVSEVVQTLVKKVDRELEWEELPVLTSWFIGMPVTLLPSKTLIFAAIANAQLLGITTYDALYVAAAVEMKVPLVTGDREMIKAARRHGLSDLVVNLDEFIKSMS
jgi:predicted nucleic acid-binding protein